MFTFYVILKCVGCTTQYIVHIFKVRLGNYIIIKVLVYDSIALSNDFCIYQCNCKWFYFEIYRKYT